jgi:hypothetical protein
MDEPTRAQFIDRIKREVGALTEHDQNVMQHAITVIIAMTSDPRLGPLTLLMPSEEAIARIDTEEQLSPGLCDQFLDLFLDQVILGELPPPSEAARGQVQFSTLGGASVTLDFEQGKLFLTDLRGRRVGVSNPVVEKPRFSVRISDDFLMLDERNLRLGTPSSGSPA